MMRVLTLIFVFASYFSFSQTATIYGTVTDANNNPVEDIFVSVVGTSIQPYITGKDGKYELQVPAEKQITITFYNQSYIQKFQKMTLTENAKILLNATITSKPTEIEVVEVTDENRTVSGIQIPTKVISVIPTASGDFNAILFSQPGVANRNELSSQYSVRGGNFDENLVYVNDIEVYRPFLVRSGQQEGLSFVNSDMVSSILFSAGGFEAKYGDKMSSVLDIQYRRPRKFAGTVSGSLLGSNLHLEGASKDYRFTWILGTRYKSNRYVLGGLDTQGDYRPSFTDVQTFLTYDVTDKWELGFLGNVARNRYNVVPQTRETRFGTINEALKLTVYFDGQEIDEFNTYMGAFTATYRNADKMKLKFITSGFKSKETETFDIQGQYYIDELETDFGKETFGQVAFNRGIGTFLNHARNYLDAYVYNAEHKGSAKNKLGEILWGAKYQAEFVEDKLSEWQMIDSAGYSLPQASPEIIELQNVIKTKIKLSSNRVSGYLQQVWSKETKDTSKITLTAGVRASHWSINNQTTFSPRLTFAYAPNWKRDVVFRASSGLYHQPPFYRELRDLNGVLNKNLKAQTSMHFVLASDLNFKAWDRPFKFITEVYYKQLENVVPYEIDNVRIRYYAHNYAKGFARGIDMKINGEFVKDIESWASLSIMQTKEDIKNDFYYDYFNSDGEKIIPGFTFNNKAVDSVRNEPGYIPRPTEQLVTFGLFFQDNMPKLPDFKMHLNLLFGTGVPFGPPSYERYKDTLRMPTYRRVDIGFSYSIIKEDKKSKSKFILNKLKSLWIGLEVFNLLQVSNTISYFWIKDVVGRQYAIPSYLTSRQLNLRVVAKF